VEFYISTGIAYRKNFLLAGCCVVGVMPHIVFRIQAWWPRRSSAQMWRGAGPQWRQKWMNMSDEERAKFREEWRQKRCGSRVRKASGRTKINYCIKLHKQQLPLENNMKKKPGILGLLKPYSGIVILLILFTLVSNGINLMIPKLISHGIDSFSAGQFSYEKIIIQFLAAIISIFIFSYFQSIIQTYASERVARDLRTKLSDKISKQSYAFIQEANPSKIIN
jgi:uncharacterized membrane protein YvlD (DUF360 family)